MTVLTRMAIAAACASFLAAAPGAAATLTFSGGVDAAPTDFPTYFKHVYCDRLPAGRALRDPDCQTVARWIAVNAGRPRGAWTPPPLLD